MKNWLACSHKNWESGGSWHKTHFSGIPTLQHLIFRQPRQHVWCPSPQVRLLSKPRTCEFYISFALGISLHCFPLSVEDWYTQIYIRIFSSLDPGWCGSVDWVPACEPKGHRFDSQSGHMPGLQARSPIGGVQEATTHWCFSPSLSPSLLLCLKIIK